MPNESSEIQKFSLILFILPDGRVVLQRRTNDAPYAPGKLGLFGGWVEKGETVEGCLWREIKEETSLDTTELKPVFLIDFVIPAGEDFEIARHFYLYKAALEDNNFEVYEGDAAEAISLEEIYQRTDLAGATKYLFTKILPKLNAF